MFGMQDMRIDDVAWALCVGGMQLGWIPQKFQNPPKARGEMVDGELGAQQMSAPHHRHHCQQNFHKVVLLIASSWLSLAFSTIFTFIIYIVILPAINFTFLSFSSFNLAEQPPAKLPFFEVARPSGLRSFLQKAVSPLLLLTNCSKLCTMLPLLL